MSSSSSTTQTRRIQIILAAEQADATLRELDKATRLLEADLRRMKPGSAGWEQGIAQLERYRQRARALREEISQRRPNDAARLQILINGKKPEATFEEISAAVQLMERELRTMDPRSPGFRAYARDLSELRRRQDDVRRSMQNMTRPLSEWKEQILGFAAGGIVSQVAVNVFGAITGAMSGAISKSAELSDQFADIQKTSDMSAAEVEEFNRALGKIDTRTASKELRDIAIIGGQLGISKEQMLSFVDGVDKLNVALGDEISGGAEEVTKVVGGLRNVLVDIKSEDVGQDLLHIGNALNTLGSQGAATSPIMADFANRIGGIGIPLGLTSGQVFGLSATLQELNVNVERGGTAVGRILQRMLTNTASFAKVAGISVKDFTALLNEDLYGAFKKVVEGAAKGGASSTALAEIIKDLNVDGAGASEVFLKLGKNMEKLEEKVQVATGALQNQSSIMSEFEKKNTNFAANLEKTQKMLLGIFMSAFRPLVNTVGYVIDAFQRMTREAAPTVEAQTRVLTASIAQSRQARASLSVYEELNNKKNRSVAENLKLADAQQKLVRIYGDEILQVNKLTGALEVNIEAVKKKLMLSAALESQKAKELMQKRLEYSLIEERGDKAAAQIDQLGARQRDLFRKIEAGGYFKLIDEARRSGDHFFTEEVNRIQGMWIAIKSSEDAKKALADINGQLSAMGINLDELAAKEAKTAGETAKANAAITVSEEDLKRALEAKKKLLQDIARLNADAIDNEEEREIAQRNLQHQLALQQLKDDLKATEGAWKSKAEMRAAEAEALKAIEHDYQRDITNIRQKYKVRGEQTDYDNAVRWAEQAHVAAKLHLLRSLNDQLITREEYNTRMEDAEREHSENRINIARRFGKETLALELEEAQRTRKQMDQALSDEQGHREALLRIMINYSKKGSRERLHLQHELLDLEFERELSNLKATEEEKARIRAQYNQRKKERANEEFFEELGKAGTYAAQIAGHTAGIMNSFNNKATAQEDAELARFKASVERRKEMNARMYENKTLTAEEYNSRMKDIDADYDAYEKKVKTAQAERNKRAAIANAWMQLPLVILQSLSSAPWPANLILSAAAGAAAMFEINRLSAVSTEFAEGGYTEVTGFQSGRKFRAKNEGTFKGGYYAQPTTALVGEAGGEYVIPAWMLRNPGVANTARALEAIRTGGGNAGAGGSNPAVRGAQRQQGSAGQLMQSAARFAEAADKLDKLLSEGITAKLSYERYTKDLAAVETAKRNARMG